MVTRVSRGSKPDLSHRVGGDRGWRGEKSWRWGLSRAATSPLSSRSGGLWSAAPSPTAWPQWPGPRPPAHSSACTSMPCHLPSPLTQCDPAEHGQSQSWVPPLEILEHLPPKPESAYFLLCALTYTSDFTGGCPPLPLSEKRVKLQLQLIKFLGVTRGF